MDQSGNIQNTGNGIVGQLNGVQNVNTGTVGQLNETQNMNNGTVSQLSEAVSQSDEIQNVNTGLVQDNQMNSGFDGGVGAVQPEQNKKGSNVKLFAIIGGIVAGVAVVATILAVVFLAGSNGGNSGQGSGNASVSTNINTNNSVNTDTDTNTDSDVDNTNSNVNNNIDDADSVSTKIIGNSEYGYVSVPSDWMRFYDTDGNDSLQYSYAGVFIVSLNALEGQYSAEQYASNYMYNRQNSGEVDNVVGSTVTIGKDKEYTAYQVYMYFPLDSVYLVTYWFEAEDGKVHYIALEGPGELGDGTKLTDFLFIPESFSLNNH